ncbi:DUF6894 family protein [Methylobacterium aerolatum]|uniref:DUF6894 domain-containing protein n=1 Tax=Methylobacterium aerolatum TaxID=418708 RepID=A0ABU0I3S4_9HYPH|nr:hypothetical protein [Methylobacterium aerolatum]MDQ0449259.1 hypothetical protein [Methylobacterium aerolatum]GJD35443.1 hypothetical protein FMGBMHLM_2353 [Methylobacterium aerolatum]
MPTRLYRFHCVGPEDAVFDRRGCRLPTLAQVRSQADRVALALMERGGTADWTRWIVDVHDGTGRRVLIRAFADTRVGPETGRRAP